MARAMPFLPVSKQQCLNHSWYIHCIIEQSPVLKLPIIAILACYKLPLSGRWSRLIESFRKIKRGRILFWFRFSGGIKYFICAGQSAVCVVVQWPWLPVSGQDITCTGSAGLKKKLFYQNNIIVPRWIAYAWLNNIIILEHLDLFFYWIFRLWICPERSCPMTCNIRF